MSRISAVTLFVVFLLAARAAGDQSSEEMGNTLAVPVPTVAAELIEGTKDLSGDEEAVLSEEMASAKRTAVLSVQSFLEESITIDPIATVSFTEFVPPMEAVARENRAAPTDPIPSMAAAGVASSGAPVGGAVLAELTVASSVNSYLEESATIDPTATVSVTDNELVPPMADAALAPVPRGPAAPVLRREERALNPTVADDASSDPADSMEIASTSSPKPIPVNIPGQTSSSPNPTSVSATTGVQPTTAGIMSGIIPFFSPITVIIYQFLDSILRNVFSEKLPCYINSFTPLKIACTPLM